MLKRAPVVIHLYPNEVHKADLIRELKINRHNVDRELLRQPTLYAWWASLYSAVCEKTALLQEKLDGLEARLSIRYSERLKEGQKRVRVSDIKYYVYTDEKYKELRKKLRRWHNSERILRFAERAFQQRKDVLQSYSANVRREQDSEPKVRKRHRGEEDEE